ncbi:hypothetical protein IV203_027524 [Nitzschia inconspicua]|uniref:Uncharacterized protein n=1 Tax=Nitzschia inconspicua TaxID=303405 RepID=A0A9K3Q3L0_9STRA|nr:hypothetical protein IV203_027524 [Nitzschia inconspicua]
MTTTAPSNCVASRNLDDDSDDDDLAFLAPRVFPYPSTKKKKKCTTAKVVNTSTTANKNKRKRLIQKSPQDRNSNMTNTQGNVLNTKRNDPVWIEEQAKKIVDGLSMDIVRGVVDTDMVGWEVVKKGKGKGVIVKYYPTIRLDADNDEGRVLLEEKQQTSRVKNGIIVKYLGVSWSLASKYDYITENRWEPCNFGSESTVANQSSSPTKKRGRGRNGSTQQFLDDEGRLKNFLNHIKSSARFKDEPVDWKVEELAVRKIWEAVAKQQKEYETKKAYEEEERATMRLLAPVVSQDESSPPINDDHYEQSDDEEDDDNDVGVGQSSLVGSNSKENGTPPMLQTNDEVEFYAPEGVAGNPTWLRRAKILGIRPDHEYPLVFSELINLPRTHHVRKLPNGYYRAIQTYQLSEQGEKNIAASLNNQVSNLKRAREEVNKAADHFWKIGQAKNGNAILASKQSKDTNSECAALSFSDVIDRRQNEKNDAPLSAKESEMGSHSKRSNGLATVENIISENTDPQPRSKRQRKSTARMNV